MNLIDWAVGLINPAAGLRRHVARKALARAYEAASTADGWRPRRAGASADSDHRADAAAIRAKARSLYQNVPYITAGMDGRVSHAVGHGIGVEFSGSGSETKNAAFKRWTKNCDYSGMASFGAIQDQVWRTWDVDGEVLVRLRFGDDTGPDTPPVRLQPLEVEWLDMTRERSPDTGNPIVNGVEYDLGGKRVAYWIWRHHPTDTTLVRGLRNESERVPAREVIHLFQPKRPQQNRGFSRMSSAIARTRDFSLYEDAERARKNLESRLSVVATSDISGLRQIDAESNTDPTSRDLGTLSVGGITQIGASGVTVVEPKAMPGYVETAKWEVHLISAGCGFTYEMATGDMREANFTQGRMRMLTFRREIEQMQWLHFIPGFMERVVEAFVEAGALAGLWARSRAWEAEYATPRWEYIQPDQEVSADIKEIGTGLASISSKLRARGEDPKKVFAQWKQDMEQLKADGTWDYMLFLTRGNLPTPPQQGDQADGEPT